jgi:DNA-binding transcriptional LysR family regulator
MEMLSLGLDAAASLGDDVSGRLRINLPRALLPLLANRLLPDFLEAYPNVQLELCGDDNLIDIVERGFDAGIRMARSIPTDMTAVPLTPRIRFAVVAAASYILRHGRPSRPRELEQFNCIQLQRSTGSIFDWNFVEEGKPIKVPINGLLIVNDVEVCPTARVARRMNSIHDPRDLIEAHRPRRRS